MGKLKNVGLILGVVFALSLMAQEKAADQPHSQSGQTIKKPKPYGCYKDLRWGISFEDAQKSLGIKLEKDKNDSKKNDQDSLMYLGEVKIGQKNYPIQLFFDKEGLNKVWVRTHESYDSDKVSDEDQLKSLIEAFDAFKPSLLEKFGKPTTDVIQDRGSDINLQENILKRKASIKSIWETEESTIALQVELEDRICIDANDCITIFNPLLAYEKKNKNQSQKVEL